MNNLIKANHPRRTGHLVKEISRSQSQIWWTLLKFSKSPQIRLPMGRESRTGECLLATKERGRESLRDQRRSSRGMG